MICVVLIVDDTVDDCVCTISRRRRDGHLLGHAADLEHGSTLAGAPDVSTTSLMMTVLNPCSVTVTV